MNYYKLRYYKSRYTRRKYIADTFSVRFLAGVHITVALACTEDDGCLIYYNLSGGTLVIPWTPAVSGRRAPPPRRHTVYIVDSYMYIYIISYILYSHATRVAASACVYLPESAHEACSNNLALCVSRFVCCSFRLKRAAAASRANERIIPLLRRRSPTLP